MRYRDIGIRTLRESPAGQMAAARAMLIRAGYLGAHSEPTALGERVIRRLELLTQAAENLWHLLGLEVRGGSSGTKVFLSQDGEVDILACAACGYAASAELAKARRVSQSGEEMLAIQRIATPECNTIDSLAAFLGIPKAKTAKAMMYTRDADSQFVFVVIRGDARIAESKLQALLGALRAATQQEILAAGAVPGYASPVGLQQPLVVADEQIPDSRNLAAGANEIGFHLLNTNYGRDYTADIIADVALVDAGDACPDCGSPLAAARGYVLEDDGGYRFGNVMLALAETYHDERGLRWPARCAPFDAHLLHVASKDADTLGFTSKLYEGLESDGLEILFDDRDERAGVKFYDADLIGLPWRLTVGAKSLADGLIELKARGADTSRLLPSDAVAEAIRSARQGP